MRKIKIFRLGMFDDQIIVNEWLAKHKSAIIHQVLQSESGSDSDGTWSLTITIFYYEGEQGQ